MDAAHVQRVTDINQEFSHEIEESDRRWNELKQQVLERRKLLVEVEPGTESKPVRPVVSEFVDAWNACNPEGISEELEAGPGIACNEVAQ
jgi:hypothetical protein